MDLKVFPIASICILLLCATACSPASDYKDNEERWLGNQLTQPVQYRHMEDGSTAKSPLNATEQIPTTANQTSQTSTHPAK